MTSVSSNHSNLIKKTGSFDLWEPCKNVSAYFSVSYIISASYIHLCTFVSLSGGVTRPTIICPLTQACYGELLSYHASLLHVRSRGVTYFRRTQTQRVKGTARSKRMTHSHQKQTITPYPDLIANVTNTKRGPTETLLIKRLQRKKILFFIINKNLYSAIVSGWDEDEWSSDRLQFLLLKTLMTLYSKREEQLH